MEIIHTEPRESEEAAEIVRGLGWLLHNDQLEAGSFAGMCDTALGVLRHLGLWQERVPVHSSTDPPVRHVRMLRMRRVLGMRTAQDQQSHQRAERGKGSSRESLEWFAMMMIPRMGSKPNTTSIRLAPPSGTALWAAQV